jgi:HD-GYP domain-containing protein (c-di-GMP phosphodiesterase class II)
MDGLDLPSADTFNRLRATANVVAGQRQEMGLISNSAGMPLEEHSHRTALFSWRIACLLGISRDDAARILRGSYLHDIGVGIDLYSCLRKSESLSAEERLALQSHPQMGYELLCKSSSTSDVAPMALSHHERFDGGGYPNGLRGTKIPVESRVLAIADSLDAMMSRRPYRTPFTYFQAMGEIMDGAGKQFDPGMAEMLAARAKTFADFLGTSEKTAYS